MEEFKQQILDMNPDVKLDPSIDFALIGYIERAGDDYMPVYNKTFLENTKKLPKENKHNCYATLGLILNDIAKIEPEALSADGLEGAIIGLVELPDGEVVILYDVKKCIETLVKDDDMAEEDAWDHYYYNVVGGYVGKKNTSIYDIKRRSFFLKFLLYKQRLSHMD